MTLRIWTVDIMNGYLSNLREAQHSAIRFTERSGLADDGPLNAGLQATFGDGTFEQTRTPLHLVATDFYNGNKVVLSRGRLFDVIRASLAMPTVFPPREIDGRLLVDGAAADPLPIDVAIKEGGQVVLAMGFEVDYYSHMNSLAAINSQLNSIYTNNLLRASFAFHNLAHHDEIIPILPNFERKKSMFDTHEMPYIIEQGERAAEEHMPYLRRLLSAG